MKKRPSGNFKISEVKNFVCQHFCRCYTPCDKREWDFIEYNILFEQRKISFPKTALT